LDDTPENGAWRLTFRIDKSMRYHQRRRAFFDRCHRLVMFAVILCGSAAFVGIVPAAWTAVLGAMLAALDLTLGFSMKARDHQILYQRFAELYRKIQRSPEPKPEEIAFWQDEMLVIETDEPPIMVALEVDCHNETARAWNARDSKVPVLSAWQRLTMHLLSHEKS
jgi:hypothetical protein